MNAQTQPEALTLIFRAIDARACADLSDIALRAGNREDAYDYYCEARGIAVVLAYAAPNMPRLFVDHPTLSQAWKQGAEDAREERAEVQRQAELERKADEFRRMTKAEKRRRVKSLIHHYNSLVDGSYIAETNAPEDAENYLTVALEVATITGSALNGAVAWFHRESWRENFDRLKKRLNEVTRGDRVSIFRIGGCPNITRQAYAARHASANRGFRAWLAALNTKGAEPAPAAACAKVCC